MDKLKFSNSQGIAVFLSGGGHKNYTTLVDNFTDLTNWVVSGDVTVSGGVVTLNDAGAGSLSMYRDLSLPQDVPYCIEMSLSIANGSGQKLFVSLRNGTTEKISFKLKASNETTHILWSETQSDVAFPVTNFVSTTKFKIIFYVDPVNRIGRFYHYHQDSVDATVGRMVQPGPTATFGFNAGAINRINFATSGTGTGAATVEALKIYKPWAVIIGDSIATGHPGYDPIPGFYATQQRPYSIDSYLESDRNSFVRVINNGVGGHNSSNLAGRFETMVVNMTPKYAIIEIGSNDTAAVPFSTYQANMATIVDAIIAAGIVPAILEIPPRNNLTSGQKQYVLDANAWLLNTFCPARGINLYRCYAAMEDPANPGNLLPAYTDDNIHPNAAGYRVMASALAGLTW